MSKRNRDSKEVKVTLTEAVAAANRKRVIEFYTTEGNYSKHVTAQHFKDIRKSTVYKILKKYEDRKKEGVNELWKRKKIVGKPRVCTEETFRKYEELIQMDPNMSGVEAAQILHTSRKTICKIKRVLKQRKLNGTAASGIPTSGFSNSNDNEEIEDGILDWNDNDDDISDSGPAQSEQLDKKPDLKKTKKKISRHCLACFDSFQLPDHAKRNTLVDNLNAIFVLKNLLDIPSDELVNVLKLSKGINPGDWVSFCSNCCKVVEECLDIQSKIKKLEERLLECKDKICESIKETPTSYSKGISDKDSLLLTKRVREIVKKQKRSASSKTKNPFEEGDKKAESLIVFPRPQQELQQVKVDIDDLDDFDHSPNFDGIEDAEVETDIFTDPPAQPPTKPENVRKDVVSQENARTTNFENVEEEERGTDVIPPIPLGICDTCGMEMRPLALPMHKLLEHDTVMEGYTVKKCTHEDCDYKTLYDVHFLNHKKKHTSRNLACSYCGKCFHAKYYLTQHEQIHKNAESRPYVCEICGTSFAVANYFYAHKRQQHGKRVVLSTNRKRSNVEGK